MESKKLQKETSNKSVDTCELEQEYNDKQREWPRLCNLYNRFRRESEDWWRDWPKIDTIMPQFDSQLHKLNSDWRRDPFWRDIYPKWAEPLFKGGMDVQTNITNDCHRFAVEIDTYQFQPNELQVKTYDDTLLIEGRHEDVRDLQNYTKMYFVRKYQLPSDVRPEDIISSIDSKGRLTVEAQKRNTINESSSRIIPIECSPSSLSSKNYFLRNQNSSNQYQNTESSSNFNFYHNSPIKDKYSNNEYFNKNKEANALRRESHCEESRNKFCRSESYSSLFPSSLLNQDSKNYYHYRSESLKNDAKNYNKYFNQSTSRNAFFNNKKHINSSTENGLRRTSMFNKNNEKIPEDTSL